ncbi:uncharacterized protein LOC127803280 [Diospyros lotus]|uniref:uncharacterized protein LOC127803280 n=1 Tax=Diospyros lotus TaxID=55363 RepID=UPI00225B91A6|nr:uncharacterized protein LOC127803280 [Diospyros lotus]XP_052195349.1 uncharacterized protein LOC127803280 [Diospyros lotus]
MSDHVSSEKMDPTGAPLTPKFEKPSGGEPISVKIVGADEGVKFSFSNDQVKESEKALCRICHEEDLIKKMESPCACCGSLKFAHRSCVQRWCNEKKNTICEICHQPYKAGYTAPALPNIEDAIIDIREGMNGPADFVLGVPPARVMAAAGEENFGVLEYGDECITTSGALTAIIRSSVLIVLAILMMRHAFSLVNEDEKELCALFSIFLLRILAVLMPIYITTWITTVLHQRFRRHERVGFVATGPAMLMPSGRRRAALQFAASSSSSESGDETHEL